MVFVDVFFFIDEFLLVLEILGEVAVADFETHFVVAFGGLAGGEQFKFIELFSQNLYT